MTSIPNDLMTGPMTKMVNSRNSILWGAALGGLGVGLGAFGAHALKPILLANNKLDAYEIAVRYQLYHSFGLILIGLLLKHLPHSKVLRWSAISWIIGVILFSGSLYVISFTFIREVAFLTPLGGAFFLSGWVMLFWSVLKNK